MMGLMQLKIWLIIGFLMSQAVLAGTFTAEIDKKQSNLEDPFWLTIGVQGSLDDDVLVPASDDFEIIRTGESTNISIVNGTMTKERQYTYQVRPLKEGTLTIPSFKAKVDDENLQTEPITVVVKGGVAAPSQNDAASNKKLVFVERDLPKTSIYEGEVIISKVRLLTRARLTGATPAREAAPDWRLIPVDGQRNIEVTRDGTRWNAIELTEGLIPLRSGKLKVPPFGINASWIQPTQRKANPRSIFDMFQGGAFNMGEEVSRKLQSDPVNVTVKPLPAPKPADFSDLVGAFTVASTVSKRALNVGETATVTIEIKGQGALDRMRDIKLNIAGARVYDDKPALTEKIEAGAGLVSTRVFKFAVVPSVSGKLDLGVIKLSSFNPFTEAYDALSTSLGSIDVGGSGAQTGLAGAPGTTQSSATGQQEPKTDQNQEVQSGESPPPAPMSLAPKAIDVASAKSTRPWYLGPVALAIEVLLIVVAISVFMVRRGWRKMRDTAPVVSSTIRSELENAIQLLDSNQPDVIDRAMHALKKSLADQGQDPGAMTTRDLIRNAESREFDVSQLQALNRILVEMDRRTYGGDSADAVDANFVSELRKLLSYCQTRAV